jgi:hypothetical protein
MTPAIELPVVPRLRFLKSAPPVLPPTGSVAYRWQDSLGERSRLFGTRSANLLPYLLGG